MKVKFFNTLNLIGFPNYCFQLKDEMTIMLQRKYKPNINNEQWTKTTYHVHKKLNNKRKNNYSNVGIKVPIP